MWLSQSELHLSHVMYTCAHFLSRYLVLCAVTAVFQDTEKLSKSPSKNVAMTVFCVQRGRYLTEQVNVITHT